MHFFSWNKTPNNPPANALTSPSIQQPRLVCTWSAHAPQSDPGPLSLPFPRHSHTLTTTSTGKLFLFGGNVHGRESGGLYVFLTLDYSTTLLQTSGRVPTPRYGHSAVLIDTTTLLICGGKTEGGESVLHHDSIYLLNLESREWSCVPPAVGMFRQGCCSFHTASVVGSELFIFGGMIDGMAINDIWTLNLSRLKLQPSWKAYELTPGNKKPLRRHSHVSVTAEDRIIIFGGCDNEHFYNDTWSFDISMRKWIELQCTGSIPSPRSGHAAVLVDDVMYVFGGFSRNEGNLGDFYALQLSTHQWFKIHNAGQNPHRRSYHGMASVGTRIFVLGGDLRNAQPDEVSLIHVFDTKDIKHPEPKTNPVNRDEKATQLMRKSSVSPTQELSVSLSAQTKRDQRIAQLTEELALKSDLLEQAEANAVEGKRRASLELVDMKSKLDESLLSFGQQTGRLEEELANVRAKLKARESELEAKESELEALRLRLADTEKGLTKSKAETSRCTHEPTGSVNRDEDQVTRGLLERVRALEAQMVSKRWNEKSIEDMECSNEKSIEEMEYGNEG